MTDAPSPLAGALARYRVMAFVTGTFLLIVFVGLIRYVPGIDEPEAVDEFFGWVAIVHGWIYVVYLIVSVHLWVRARWGLGRLVYLGLGGVIPLLSFFAERRVSAEVRAALEA